MSLKSNLQANLGKQPHSVITLLLLALAAFLIVVALTPDHWLFKVLVAVWVIVP